MFQQQMQGAFTERKYLVGPCEVLPFDMQDGYSLDFHKYNMT